MGFTIEAGVPAITVFIQGILSFFSPCVLPLVPLYIGYLAGGTKTVKEDGSILYSRKKVMLNTLFFVIGVSFSFFLLGLGFSTLGRFFSGNRMIFARIGGILVILFGLFQLGFFGSRILEKERRLPFRLNTLAMNPILAMVLGFTFSFAWTPCVGPALASVLLLASSANSSALGFVLIGVYTLGFVLPFLAVGLFTSTLLDFFKKHQKVIKYTVKAGGILMIFMGVLMWTGWMNGITGYLSRFTGGSSGFSSPEATSSPQITEKAEAEAETSTPAPKAPEESTQKTTAAPDFTLVDQNGDTHTLSDYKGKTVFLNFWATWCGPCQNEMPDIQSLYEEYGYNKEEVIILGVANPKTDLAPFNQDVSQKEVEAFLSENNYTYPVVMDLTGKTYSAYGISSFPTTFMIDAEGNVYGAVSGMLTKSIMENIIKQTMDGASQAQ